MGDPQLTVEDLYVRFPTSRGTVEAVNGITFNLDKGQMLGIVGESGCGKTVMMKAVMDLLPSTAEVTGSITFDGEDVLSMDKARRKHFYGVDIAMVFQNPMTSLNPVKRIGDQLMEGMRFHRGLSKAAARARAIELLEQMQIPKPRERIRQYPHELSGGMRQRVVIAMALANDPRLLIADEPTTALDVTVQREILELLDELRRDLDMAMVLITHDLSVASDRTDNVLVMRNGDMMEMVPTARLFDDDRHPYTLSLRKAMPDITQSRGTTPVEAAPDANSHLRDEEALIRVEDLVVEFGKRETLFRAVDRVSFDVLEGETLGIVGESGCGKSTTAKSIIQLPEPTSGSVRYRGQELTELNPEAMREVRPNLQLIFQDPVSALNPRRSAWDLVSEGVEIWGRHGAWTDSRIHELMTAVGIDPDHMDRKPHQFSGGQCQRLVIARALVLDPQVLICDEPTSALDVSVQAQILELLEDLKHQYQLTMLFISHDLAVVRNIADRVMVMYFGRVVEIGDTDSIFENPEHPYTKRLLSAVPGQEALGGGKFLGSPDAMLGEWRTPECRCGPGDMPVLVPRGPDHHVACCHVENIIRI
ncbi:MAG: ABC transporter ATP-binding protein [Acidimicrobiaceae bacterium]|jgi:peptide/nickel transport system ATP-binding protein|nr:ABC transporter ATP-binding protein [Acidimicrobiaceae bacterium]HAB57252.1 ABC transporter ATP-binding protein [Acidimicrobiaceae bacterium]